jgi:hypothetical protein
MHAKTFDLVGGWGISFVLPTVIYELGISNTGIAQVMTMVRKFADTLIPCD